MNSILRELFDDEYDITPKRDKEQQKLYAEWDKVQRVFGDEFTDRLLALEAEQAHRRAFHYYREGFRLGVRLMLEALGT